MFINDERSIVFDGIPTIKQTINATYDIFEKFWRTSYNYKEVKPNYFSTKPLKNKYKKDKNFIKHILYINDIANILIEGRLSEKDDFLKKEIEITEEKGCSCIYTTVLLYCLLEKNGYIDKNNCFLTQGFYRYKLREDFPSFMKCLVGEMQTGLHAFLNFNGSVIDLTLYPQQKMTYDFKKTNMILGVIPSGMQLIGFNESHEIIMEYAKEFAEINNLDYESWIKLHDINADLFFIKKMIECL